MSKSDDLQNIEQVTFLALSIPVNTCQEIINKLSNDRNFRVVRMTSYVCNVFVMESKRVEIPQCLCCLEANGNHFVNFEKPRTSQLFNSLHSLFTVRCSAQTFSKIQQTKGGVLYLAFRPKTTSQEISAMFCFRTQLI